MKLGRSPRGERGLKSLEQVYNSKRARRSPRGERGLKLMLWVAIEDADVAPHAGSVD